LTRQSETPLQGAPSETKLVLPRAYDTVALLSWCTPETYGKVRSTAN